MTIHRLSSAAEITRSSSSPAGANLLSHHTLARPACCSVWCDATDRFSPLKQPNNSLQHPLRWKTQSVAGFTKAMNSAAGRMDSNLRLGPS